MMQSKNATTPPEQRFVITGGPGSGKSSLLEALATEGLMHMPEAGRAIIQSQVAIGGDALPWGNREAFAELMLSWELRSWHEAAEIGGPVLFDRGVPDVIGYRRVSGLSVPGHARRAAERFRYAETVFVAPPWEAIFAGDAERKQSFVEAFATWEIMVATYTELGYTLVELPRASIAERVAFVRDRLGR
ncbi:ATPase [Halomonas elongata]|uniref:AAA family ATPase n=1 Tax=Halomonas elongata TaxID=2746 RepID=UPI000DCE44B3|nr:AAA family ATPase [Halomonas elongata]RAW06083.1 ATPase [Halomonas elongata]